MSTDAVTRDRQQGGANDRASGTAQGSSEPKRGADLQVEVKLVKLGPGLAVTVETTTGRAQDHQLPSLAAGEVPAGASAGAITPAPAARALRVVNQRSVPRAISRAVHARSAANILLSARTSEKSTKVSQLCYAMGSFARPSRLVSGPCVYL
ncbi:hypothetical protein BDS110ZK23_52040 [Bradyrhizobium diazoefficiens]|uniref:Uncharacterized protein n=1 Tax=Bradyrhizobium diazoefficiens TaxID=1355477 RepID=A0A810AVZ0_9BRAD|nr:hypothetical protein H12S4_70560 [Bradyrhizobium diazoefficiens]BCE67870.1 hypothetical protein XF6B_66690 [Bradyrhizobium diazoefficiens]BCF02622.1 hypothetical protein XF11B_66420 [Bradyrhizobium diazoefficiens]BCF08559.1 hypothetical protein XF12B_39320 [Bradyrhizobium diazoefficiens]